MADLVSSQILTNGPKFIVVKFTNFSDATGEVGVTKLNATSTGPYGCRSQGSMLYPAFT
jgi:hypothetical protein